MENAAVKENPGPDQYNQQQYSIGMKVMRNVLEQETKIEDRYRNNDNYAKLVTKVSQKAKNDAEMKKERHVMRKKYMANKVQPGAHQNIYVQSDFKPQMKKEYLQFFGSTDVKIEDRMNQQTGPNVGPGTYEDRFAEIKKRAYTANFVSYRKDD